MRKHQSVTDMVLEAQQKRSEQMFDALRHCLFDPPPPPPPLLVRIMRAQRERIAARLYTLADWFDG